VAIHPLERVTNLLTLLLSTRRHLSFEEIRNELRGQYPENHEAARASFERDKALLRDEGVPIDQVTLGGDRAGATGYRVIREQYELGDLGLTTDETVALRMAVGAVRLADGAADEAMWKVDLDGEPIDDVATISAGLVVLPALPILHRAISARQAVEFEYNSRRRVVEPHGLPARDGWWYMVGFDRSAEGQRTFRVDRITGRVKALEAGAYEIPPGFDVRTAFPSDPKQLPDSVDVGSDTAEVLIDASDVSTVLRRYGEQSVLERRTDGSMVFAIPCSNVRAFVHWLMGFVERAEVLSPPALRAHVIGWLVATGGAEP
jgi:proteasome accessory factor B